MNHSGHDKLRSTRKAVLDPRASCRIGLILHNGVVPLLFSTLKTGCHVIR
jgi:hypothetical protein